MLNLSIINTSKLLYKNQKNNVATFSTPVIQPKQVSSTNIPFKGLYIRPGNFIKLEPISEKYSFKKLEAFFDSIDLDRSKALLNVLISTCKKENILGEGKSHVAFSIPGTNDFVLRVLKSEDIKMGTLKKEPVTFPHHNIGQTVASLVGSGADVQFMRKVKGQSIGAPYTLIRAAKKSNPANIPKLLGQDEYVSNILNISKVPQMTFTNLAIKIKMLRSHGYVYDIANPNNILLQVPKKSGLPSFNIIDDLYKIDDIKKSYYGQAWEGTLEDMVYPLMDLKAGTFYCDKSNDLINNPVLLDDVRKANAQIFQKCVNASKKVGLPLNRSKFDTAHLSKMTGIEETSITKIFYNWDNKTQ